MSPALPTLTTVIVEAKTRLRGIHKRELLFPPLALGRNRKASFFLSLASVVMLKLLPLSADSCCSLFVGNLSFDVDEDTLNQLFTDVGCNPVSTRIICREGQSRGSVAQPPQLLTHFVFIVSFSVSRIAFFSRFGYADFSSKKEAERAMKKVNGKDLFGRAVRVDVANPSQRSNSTPAGGRRGKPEQVSVFECIVFH